MERKYYVAESYRYAASGNWEYSIKGDHDDIVSAKQQYYSRLAAIIKPSNDFAMVILYDNYGNKILSDFVDTHVEPEPEPTPEDTEE